jgi:hypothetical protein
MPVYSALSPVSAGVYTVLNVAAMQALATGGIGDDINQGSTDRFLLVEVNEEPAATPTLGTKPGTGRVIEIDLRLHFFWKGEDKTVGQGAMAKAIELLADPPAVTGFASWGIFHERTQPFDEVEVAGEKVTELVAMFRLYVEEGV